jgi:hypothetical protein
VAHERRQGTPRNVLGLHGREGELYQAP